MKVTKEFGDRRVRRSSEFDGLIEDLVGKDKPFVTIRDAQLFAACLGFSRDVRLKLGKKQSEPIRWDVMSNRPGTEMAVNLIAVLKNPEDPEILSEERFDERISIFEEYASGGFSIIRDITDSSPNPIRDSLLQLINEFLPKVSGDQENDITGALEAMFN